jgi:hypothetical protein
MADSSTFEPTYTVNNFCMVEDISKAKLYEFWKAGKGPRFYKVGKSRRITYAARIEWHRQLEAEAATAEAV